MARKIFVRVHLNLHLSLLLILNRTGITGYIGGQTVAHLVQTRPDLDITALVRNEEQTRIVKIAFPETKTVIGDLDSVDLLVQLSAEADVVLQCASADHPVGTAAIAKGIRQKRKPAGSAPGFLIHTSGTGILGDPDQPYGSAPTALYDDVADIKTITSFPLTRWHRNVDKIILEAAACDPIENPKIKTTIVCPPTIYGTGTGPIRTRSVQLPDLAKASLRRGGALNVNEGRAYVILVEEALKGGGEADWNAEGYYFVENGHNVWRDLASAVGVDGFRKGYFKAAAAEALSVEEALKLQGPPLPGRSLRGVNPLGIASRIRRLRWKPYRSSTWDSVSDAVDIEARALGVKGWS
ncbi:hypothetical protein BDV12DRAFT_208808 [Aspergillus spectabilis]